VRQDLPRFDQEHHPGGGQRHMVGAAFKQADGQLSFQPLHLLAQRRLDDVLALGRPAEVQLLRQRHEVAQLPKLHARHQFRFQPSPRLRIQPYFLRQARRSLAVMGSCPIGHFARGRVAVDLGRISLGKATS
jgi:hypothetical protein